MGEHFDAQETQDPRERAGTLFGALPNALAAAVSAAPGWARHLASVDAAAVTSPEALAALPVLRKADLMEAQRQDPPFGGFVPEPATLARLFVSPGPVAVGQGREADPFGAARALHAAGARPGDVALNTFGYHLTPGAFILESGLQALGCPAVPAGPGNTDAIIAAMRLFRPTLYCGVPDFLNILLDKAGEATFTHALVSGAALPPALRETIEARGVRVAQAYATADLGVVAYESEAREGLIVNEGLIVEVVRPGTGDPVPHGEVGEVVVTRLSPSTPLFRFATGDLSKVLPGPSPCGRTNLRLAGWMGRADQRTKVKGMFVDPAQIAALVRAEPAVEKARLTVTREGHSDVMTLKVEASDAGLAERLEAALRNATGLSGKVEIVPPGSLPNDGKVIADERPVES